jgi:S1-C subfamily serine protease
MKRVRYWSGLLLAMMLACFGGTVCARDASPVGGAPLDVLESPKVSSAVVDPAQSIVRVVCRAGDLVGTAFKHRSGKFLATHHAVGACQDVVMVLPSGSVVDAKVMARDAYSDLALLEPSAAIPGPSLQLSLQATLQVGTPIASWGYPAGYDGTLALLSMGYVAGSQRVQVAPERAVEKLVISANYNAGLSGSPIMSSAGQVIGIVSGNLSPLSDAAMAALRALRAERGVTYVWQQPDGSKLNLSQGQVVGIVLEELRKQVHYVVGLATPLDEVREFLVRSGVEP